MVVPLDYWSFGIDRENVGERQEWFKWGKIGPQPASWVGVPHTWQIQPDKADYQGVAWYRTEIEAPAHWAEKVVRIEFEAVYHSAKVWLNGQLLGEHLRKGYTAFSFDISKALQMHRPNNLVVKVDNSFDPDMLPRNNSYDWAQDGGITRPVSLLITPKVYIDRIWITPFLILRPGERL